MAVGRVKERGVREAIDDYASRIRRYVGYAEVEVDDEARLEPAARKAARSAIVVPLDAGGTELDSAGFAKQLERFSMQGKGEVAFCLGGKKGIDRALLDAAPFVLSLSRMTLPHRLARLFLAEQIYRAMTLLRGEPYGA